MRKYGMGGSDSATSAKKTTAAAPVAAAESDPAKA